MSPGDDDGKLRDLPGGKVLKEQLKVIKALQEQYKWIEIGYKGQRFNTELLDVIELGNTARLRGDDRGRRIGQDREREPTRRDFPSG
jgi:hypothetical protein